MKTIEEKTHEAAIKFLKGRNYRILQEGFEYPGFSVDLVAIDNNCGDLVFVKEKVKDAYSYTKNAPLTEDERRNFACMILSFLDTHDDIVDMPVRLDYFGLYPKGNRALIEHHINAERSTN